MKSTFPVTEQQKQAFKDELLQLENTIQVVKNGFIHADDFVRQLGQAQFKLGMALGMKRFF